ncbi:enterochelin esterase-like enzyme [Wenyingzhuangia heitensis]|uniref:Enterochelin esterase-like enzyme n=1 Tax=Wenyingzhuangia heitensis TaxID=1487859 RepID=A0ABX0UG07_9FLAO|nr:alpha/beta hydrolase-fold protein [Wenyingzhuangia heitensis]NIJ45947.1 enterochelin esterase-like enzyme [Wenyingzhuangia heitensis]
MSKFRTTELSDAQFESNNLRYITVKSNNLKGRGDLSVFVPSDKEYSDLPIVVLLHGVYGSHWIWSQKTGIHLKMKSWIEAREIEPMIVVMPSDGLWGDGSGYVPHYTGVNFEKWIVEDVINAVVELIPQASEKSKLFISGLSMGGFGALRIGLKHHDKFTGVSGLSSITVLEEMKLFVEEDLEAYQQSISENISVLKTALKHKDNLPPFRFDCGVDDELIEGNRTLHQELKKEGIPHIYKENPGKHEWIYWETHIKETILFFNNLL